jgi:hypothetical protein
VVKDLVEAPPLILEINGGLMKVIHLLLLLAGLTLLVLQLLFKAGVFGQGFLELSLQPLHRNGMTLLHPLESGLQLVIICMAEIIAEYWSTSAKVLNLQMAKESYRYEQAAPADPPRAIFSLPAPSLAS